MEQKCNFSLINSLQEVFIPEGEDNRLCSGPKDGLLCATSIFEAMSSSESGSLLLTVQWCSAVGFGWCALKIRGRYSSYRVEILIGEYLS